MAQVQPCWQRRRDEVFVSDMSKIKDNYKKVDYDHNIEWEEGHHTEEKILDADEVIKESG